MGDEQTQAFGELLSLMVIETPLYLDLIYIGENNHFTFTFHYN